MKCSNFIMFRIRLSDLGTRSLGLARAHTVLAIRKLRKVCWTQVVSLQRTRGTLQNPQRRGSKRPQRIMTIINNQGFRNTKNELHVSKWRQRSVGLH